MAKSASLPLVMNVFSPLSIQSSPSRRARSLDVRGVRAGAGLGDGEAGDPVALDRGDQELLLLLLVGVVQDVVGLAAEPELHERAARSRSRSATGVTAGRFIPPYSSGVDRPQKPNFFAFSCSSRSSSSSMPGWWRRSRRSASCSRRHDLVGDELAGRVADRPLFLGQREINHARQCAGWLRRKLESRSVRVGSITSLRGVAPGQCAGALARKIATNSRIQAG